MTDDAAPKSDSVPEPAAPTAPEALAATEPSGSGDALAAAQAEIARLTDAWMRARAEVENVRRAAQAETAKAHKFAIEGFAESLLAVKDSLEATLAAPDVDPKTLRSGVELTLKQLAAAFERARVVEIDPAGERFDPNRHQAMTTVECDLPANRVVQVFQKGYLLNERVLRPALVSVATPRAPRGVESADQ